MSEFEFTDDSNDAAEYLKALEESEKSGKDGKNSKEDRIEFFSLEVGKSADVRIVQIPGFKTYYPQKIHYLAAINLKEVNLPKNVKSVTCIETDKASCVGEKCEEYIVAMKNVHEFDSQENKDLFKKQCTVKASPVLNLIVLDRRDKKVKLWQANRPTMVEILAYFNDKDEEGNLVYPNPAHPVTGFDFKVTRKDKKTYALKNLKSKPLSEEDISLIKAVKDPFAFVKYRGTKECHDRIKVTFGELREDTKVEHSSSTVVESPEVSHDVKTEIPEDDIPF